jgi:hypothetical protein
LRDRRIRDVPLLLSPEAVAALMIQTMLTPREATFVLEMAREEERKAWDRARPGPVPNRDHVTHALALRIALGQSPEEAHHFLHAAK